MNPITLLTNIDLDSSVMSLHTCLSLKFYWIFVQDAHNTDVNEPSSNEDEGEDGNGTREEQFDMPEC